MKYRNQNLSFLLDSVSFDTPSICLEKLTKLIPMHSHSKNSYEIHYISYGCGRLISCGQTYRITPGTLFVTGPDIEHEQVSDPEDPMTEYCIYVKINDSISNIKTSHPLLAPFVEHPFWFGKGDSSFHDLMKTILSELDVAQEGYTLAIQSLLQLVILYLIRKYKEKDDNMNISDAIPSTPEDLIYLTIEEAFLYDYRDLTLEKLADLIGLGPRQTERLLRIHYNKTFLQKKTQARMSAACSLLRNTTDSISQISQALGYSSVEHFSSAFKRYTGQTASSYRLLIKKS